MTDKETRFTPGPWRIVDFIDETSHSIISATHSIVAHMEGDIGHPRNDADALLVAAAPDLYAALQDALTYVNASAFNISSQKGKNNYFGCARRIEVALAKARGEPSHD